MKARRIAVAIAVLIVAMLAGGWLYVRSITPQLELGVGYAARVACGCRFVEGRTLASCRTDFEAGMEPIRLKEDAAAKSVTAYVPLIASRTARLDPVLGCQPAPFTGTPIAVH
ncbi:conserved hypothetical protein [Sphingomonas sp. EC-HK361]|uniref:hypothetical protein n=1 Tax=Sphingomonas sp. EC-HK361 TaxID=2038397 RepID=UPI001253A497|nr:hypothetical protein [Sphingomonas sp. EC-HK361]VVT24910.1 conserved hypothetical protein [Sphingomonas sp. EC-HK361]